MSKPGAGSRRFRQVPPALRDHAMVAIPTSRAFHSGPVATADVMGYSMGARIAAYCAVLHPGRVRAAILGGLGIHLVEGVGLPESIAYALEASSLDEVVDPSGRVFRQFADQTRSDL